MTECAMVWLLRLSRSVHGGPRFREPPCRRAADAWRRVSAGRQSRLLPAVIATRFHFDGELRAYLLTPVLRCPLLKAFASGESGIWVEAGRRFKDGFVELATFTLVNVELALAPLPGIGAHGVHRA